MIEFDASALVVLSEPLDDPPEHWEAVPEFSFITLERGAATITPFARRIA